jgi:hypothetical protein
VSGAEKECQRHASTWTVWRGTDWGTEGEAETARGRPGRGPPSHKEPGHGARIARGPGEMKGGAAHTSANNVWPRHGELGVWRMKRPANDSRMCFSAICGCACSARWAADARDLAQLQDALLGTKWQSERTPEVSQLPQVRLARRPSFGLAAGEVGLGVGT